LSAERYKLTVTLSRQGRDQLYRLQALLAPKVPDGDLACVLERAMALACGELEVRKFGKLKRRAAKLTTSDQARHADSRADTQTTQTAQTTQTTQTAQSGAATARMEAAPPTTVDNAQGEALAAPVQRRQPVPGRSAAPAPSGPLPLPFGQEALPPTTTPLSKPPRRVAAGSRHIPRAVKRQVAERDEGRCTFIDASGQRCTSVWNLQYHHVVPHARQGPPTLANTTLRCRMHNLHEAKLDFGEEVVERAIARSRSCQARDAHADEADAAGASSPAAHHPPQVLRRVVSACLLLLRARLRRAPDRNP